VREWRLCQGNEAIMSEGHTCRCSWSLTTTGYRLWVVADPALAREDAVFAQAAAELGYAILDKTGDGEAQLEFEPPPPGAELRPPALLRFPRRHEWLRSAPPQGIRAARRADSSLCMSSKWGMNPTVHLDARPA